MVTILDFTALFLYFAFIYLNNKLDGINCAYVFYVNICFYLTKYMSYVHLRVYLKADMKPMSQKGCKVVL